MDVSATGERGAEYLNDFLNNLLNFREFTGLHGTFSSVSGTSRMFSGVSASSRVFPLSSVGRIGAVGPPRADLQS